MASASWPTRRAAPRGRSWMRRWRGSRTFATAGPSRPTGAPATGPACCCRSRPRSCRGRGAGWRTSSFATRAPERRSSRRASRRASRSRAGGRSRSIPKRSARPHVRALPSIEQLVLLRPFGLSADEAELRAYRARRRAARIAGRVRRLAVVPHGHVQGALRGRPAGRVLPGSARGVARGSVRDLPPALLDQHEPVVGARAAVPAPLPQRRDQHDRRQRAGDAGTRESEPAVAGALEESGSDSSLLDNALELLVRGGRDVRHAASMLLPRAWQEDSELDPDVAAFHQLPRGARRAVGRAGRDRLHGRADRRRGARSQRAAAAPRGERRVVRRLRLRGRRGAACTTPRACAAVASAPASCSPSTPASGFEEDAAIARRLAGRRPYRRWLDDGRRTVGPGEPVEPPAEDLTPRQLAAGYSREDITLLLRPSAADGHEPTSSMGDDTALPPLAGRARIVFSYLRQRFAQVTNPPIDHLRERSLMSLRDADRPARAAAERGSRSGAPARAGELLPLPLGPGRAARDPALDRTPRRRAPRPGLRAARRAGLGARRPRSRHPRAHRRGLRRSRFRACSPSAPSSSGSSRRGAARSSRSSWSATSRATAITSPACSATAPTPSVPGSRSRRWRRSPAADRLGGDHPSPEEAQRRFRAALEDGVLKVMAKMGIADVASYRGAQLFEALGLAPEVIELCLTGTPSPLGGIGFAELERELRARGSAAGKLESPGYVKYRPGGEPHATTPEVVEALQAVSAAHALRRAVDGRGGTEEYRRFAALVDGRAPLEPRDLLELVPAGPPVPIDEVEPVESILRRFSSGGMSHGSLSAEAHETVAIAFNRLGGRSNCGEGGEDPARFRDERNSRIKQVASGRFGVTRGVRRARGRAPDQDRPGLQARRGRPAARPQGHRRDRAAAAHGARDRPDLAAAASRHLLDRGSGAARLRPQAGQSGCRRLGEARRRGRCRARRGGCGQGAGRRRPRRRLRRRHRRQPALLDQERRRPVGARSRRDAADPRLGRAAEPRSPARRRGTEDRPGCRRSGAARRRRGLVRHSTASRRGLSDGALVPPRHLPGRDRDAAARAALQVRGDTGARRGVPAAPRRGRSSPPRRARSPHLRRCGRPGRMPAPAGASRCQRSRARPVAAHAACGLGSRRALRRAAARAARR